MTDQQIVPVTGTPIASLADRPLVRELGERLKLMVANGKRLTTDEALALAQYSVATDLSPFLNECYYLQNVGPGPGIAGYRRKANEELAHEAQLAHEPNSRFWCDYTDTNGEIKIDREKGDIGVKAILHDTLTKRDWERRILSAMVEFLKAGVAVEGARGMAQEIIGPEPTWSAVGVVYSGENFGGDKMPRYERACKRAEKAAIKKRFPRMRLPEPTGFDEPMSVSVVDPIAFSEGAVAEVESNQQESEKSLASATPEDLMSAREKQILLDLNYDQ